MPLPSAAAFTHGIWLVLPATVPTALSGQLGHCSASVWMRPSGEHVTPVHRHTGTLLSDTQPAQRHAGCGGAGRARRATEQNGQRSLALQFRGGGGGRRARTLGAHPRCCWLVRTHSSWRWRSAGPAAASLQQGWAAATTREHEAHERRQGASRGGGRAPQQAPARPLRPPCCSCRPAPLPAACCCAGSGRPSRSRVGGPTERKVPRLVGDGAGRRRLQSRPHPARGGRPCSRSVCVLDVGVWAAPGCRRARPSTAAASSRRGRRCCMPRLWQLLAGCWAGGGTLRAPAPVAAGAARVSIALLPRRHPGGAGRAGGGWGLCH